MSPTWLLLITGNGVLFCVLAGILLRLACTIVSIQGQSMYPTFAAGDRVVVLNWWPRRWIRKGHIILFRPLYVVPVKPPDRSVLSDLHIKRVVAVAGEQVITSIDDVQKDLRSRVEPYHDERGRRIWHIPSGHLFVRGDAHGKSIDSLIAGPLPLQSVCGLVLMKVPTGRFVVLFQRNL